MSAPDLSFAILTDTHLTAPGERIYGLDPLERLRVAIEVLNRDHPDIAFTLFLGDLAHWGQTPAYEALRDVVSSLASPVVLMMGNHDLREPFRAVFPEADDDGEGFVQALRVLPAASLLTLDTLDEEGETHAGLLCERRLGFLERALRDAPTDRPLVVAQHHPCLDLGIPSMDRIRLSNPDALIACYERVGRKPDILLHGHVHRPIFGRWEGIPFHIQRALNHQVALDLITRDHITGSLEAPDLALVRVSGGDIVIHHQSFLYDGPLYSLSDPAAVAGRFSSG